jgi:hypothetical protein
VIRENDRCSYNGAQIGLEQRAFFLSVYSVENPAGDINTIVVTGWSL